jgi:hypothetical protein
MGHLAGGKRLTEQVLEYVASKADGVPVYGKELTKAILESGVIREVTSHYTLHSSLLDLHIPDTFQGSLMARLDRVPELRELAQIAAVLGRQFSYDVLRHLAADDEVALQKTLGRLVAAEILYQRGRGRSAVYRFKHALIQEAAYASLLRRPRQRLHGRLATLLESELASEAANNPEVVAHHYSRSATHAGTAVKYWQLATDYALSRGAHAEAASQLATALQDLVKLEPSLERDRLELDLQTKLGPAITITRGYTDLQLRTCYARAQALCEALKHAERGAALFDPSAPRVKGWPGGQPGEQCLLAWVAAGERCSSGELEQFEQALARYEAQRSRLLVPVLLSFLTGRSPRHEPIGQRRNRSVSMRYTHPRAADVGGRSVETAQRFLAAFCAVPNSSNCTAHHLAAEQYRY